MTRFNKELEYLIEDMGQKVDENEVTWARRFLTGLEKSLLVIERRLQEMPTKAKGSERYRKIVLLKAQLEDCYLQLSDPLTGIEAEYKEFLERTLDEHPELAAMFLREAAGERK